MRMILLAAVLSMFAMDAAAQQMRCEPRDKMEIELKSRYGEVVAAMGLSLDGTEVMEIWVSPTGTYSVTTTNTSGISCIRAHGREWQYTGIKDGDPA